MTIIESLYNYFDKCELIDKNSPIGIDLLDEEVKHYCIETVPCKPVIKAYRDGSAMKQYIFIFASREYYGDNLVNLANSRFYEELTQWITEQSRLGNLPALPDKCEAQKIDVNSSGYVMDNDTRSARYQIQCRLKYYQEV